MQRISNQGVLSLQWDIYNPVPTPKLRKHYRGGGRAKDQDDCYRIVSSKEDRDVASMNAHRMAASIRPVNTPADVPTWMEENFTGPRP